MKHSKWKIDPAHSQLQFKVKHLAITNVNGVFKIFEGTLESAEDDFANSKIHAQIVTNSIDTQNSDRDRHLQSADLFDAEKFPHMLFNGSLTKANGEYQLTGQLTIRDISQPVEFSVTFNGLGTGRFGDSRAGFEATGKISRKDFGLTWNILAEGGGLVVGDEIKLVLDIQLIGL